MIESLKRARVLTTPKVERAMAEVPRHTFIPEADTEVAYADTAVMVKRATDGTPISSASQPTIVATMLELIEASERDRVLEIGTGTGYNAALLAALVGNEGEVFSIELEPDLAERATRALAAVAADNVHVRIGDGRAGWVDGSPYDRVIVTTGAREIAPAWRQQLRDGGRLVVPLVDDRGVGLIVSFDKVGNELVQLATAPCGFLPLRGARDAC